MLLLSIPDNISITNFDTKMTELNCHRNWYFSKKKKQPKINDALIQNSILSQLYSGISCKSKKAALQLKKATDDTNNSESHPYAMNSYEDIAPTGLYGI